MAKVHINDVRVCENPSPFSSNFQFQITFECTEELNEDLEWEIIYVGSAESDTYDQVLDSVYVGPVPVGRHTFVFEILFGSCEPQSRKSWMYLVVVHKISPRKPLAFENDLQRNILHSKPRVTRFKIDW